MPALRRHGRVPDEGPEHERASGEFPLALQGLQAAVHSNTVEGFFSLLKRGLNGIYHNVSKEHLRRYLCEFEFRYNHRHMDDGERTRAVIQASRRQAVNL